MSARYQRQVRARNDPSKSGREMVDMNEDQDKDGNEQLD